MAGLGARTGIAVSVVLLVATAAGLLRAPRPLHKAALDRGIVVVTVPALASHSPVPADAMLPNHSRARVAPALVTDGPPAEANLDLNDHANLDGYLRVQPRDSTWSASAEAMLRAAYAASPRLADPIGVTCATTLCEVSAIITPRDDADADASVDALIAANVALSGPDQPFFATSSAAVTIDPSNPRRVQIVAFLRRRLRAS